MSEGCQLAQDRANAKREMYKLERELKELQTKYATAILTVAKLTEQIEDKGLSHD